MVKRFYQLASTLKHTTWYARDAQGNILSIYERPSPTSEVKQTEVHIYGSSRIGIEQRNITYSTSPFAWLESEQHRHAGTKRYELTDHLGNVRVTISDLLVPRPASSFGYATQDAEVIDRRDYYPFGMEMPGRRWRATGEDAARFGFNGKENDDEVKGEGNQQDYGFRIYDPRVARFLSVDPLTGEYPWYTPYQFAGNTPIQAIDLDGLEEWYYANGRKSDIIGPLSQDAQSQLGLQSSQTSQTAVTNSVLALCGRANSAAIIRASYASATSAIRGAAGIHSEARELIKNTARGNTPVEYNEIAKVLRPSDASALQAGTPNRSNALVNTTMKTVGVLARTSAAICLAHGVSTVANSEDPTGTAVSVGAGFAGAYLGAEVGASAGVTTGSALAGPVGAVIGGFVGSVVGSAAGAYGGEELVRRLVPQLVPIEPQYAGPYPVSDNTRVQVR